MRYVAACLLAALGGNNNPSATDIENILGSVGIEADSEKLQKVLSEMKGKKINDLIAEGTAKLATMPAAGAAPAAAGGAPAEKKEEKKEEKEPEPESEESDEDMGFGLFD